LGSRIVCQRLRPVRVGIHGSRWPPIRMEALRRSPRRVVVVALRRRGSSLGLKPRGPRVLRWRAAGIRASSLLLLLQILGGWDLLAARDRARLALIVSISRAAIIGPWPGRSELVSIIASWRRSHGWRSVRFRHARRGRRHGMCAPILHELGRRDGRGHGLRAAGRRGGTEDVRKSCISLIGVGWPVARMLRLQPRRRHPVALVVGHGCCGGCQVRQQRKSSSPRLRLHQARCETVDGWSSRRGIAI
jgi:hypothetical protein